MSRALLIVSGGRKSAAILKWIAKPRRFALLLSSRVLFLDVSRDLARSGPPHQRSRQEASQPMNDSASAMSPPAQPRKWHIAAVLATLLAIGAATAGLAHWIFSAELLDKNVVAQIRRSTGFATTIGGTTLFHLFPQPRIDIENIAFSDAGGAVRIDAGAFSAYLRILPLLVGRIEIGHATLYQPNILIALDRKPAALASGIGRAAQTAATGEPEALQLGRIDLVDGHVRLETNNVRAAEFNDIDMDIDWPSAYASAVLSGQLTLRGMPVDLQAWLSRPIELLRGGQSATTLRLQSDLLTLSTSGRVSVASRVQYTGQVSANTASLRKLAEIAGYAFPKHGTFTDFDLRGDVDFKGVSAALTNLRMSLDGNDYEGDLAIEDNAGLPRLSGTLASDLLDLTPFLAGMPEPSDDAALWNHHALDLSDLSFADLDLRISASRLRLYDIEVDDAALSLVTKPGLIDLDLAEATSNRGAVKGRVSLVAEGQTIEFHVNGDGKDIDISPMVIDGKNPLSGALNASLALDSTGPDLHHIVEGLAGRADILVAGGEFKGTDLLATLQSANATAPGQPIALTDGTTDFDKLSFSVQLANGLAQIRQGQLSVQGLALNFAGNADFAHRLLDLAALGDLTQSTSRHSESMPLSLRLKGSFENPRLVQGESGLRLPAAPPNSDDLPNDTTSEPE
jgi:AsmA protein